MYSDVSVLLRPSGRIFYLVGLGDNGMHQLSREDRGP